jgi:hypothetical protein
MSEFYDPIRYWNSLGLRQAADIELLRCSGGVCLQDACDTTGVQHEHSDKLVHDPALVELLYLVVLLNVEGVHDRQDADELRLSGQEYLALRDDDRALNLELTEAGDLSASEHFILEAESGDV